MSAPGTATAARPTPGTNAPGRDRSLLHGSAWVVIRGHRTAFRWAGALFTVCAALLIVARLWAPVSTGPGLLEGATYSNVMTAGSDLVRLLPIAVGAFVAGPLVARELDSGTYQLLWTQSVAPLRWFAVKLAVPTAAAVAAAGVLVSVCRWSWTDRPRGNWENGLHWFDYYGVIGPVGVAAVLPAVAIGALAGLLVQRTLAAMVACVAALGVVDGVLGALRGHLWPARTVIGSLKDGYRGAGSGWPLADGAITSGGAHVTDPICVDDQQCWADHHLAGFYNTYQPASHFWPLQLVETGILLALAIIVAAVAFRVLRKKVSA
ncbi:ABC transporter permease [Streptomyces sp. NPDC051322]|uniref:ABC transporter permease n=1 Tax=Streptomyces sp. NPDC051322 TaxID=3154645 RepID=UPI00344B4995